MITWTKHDLAEQIGHLRRNGFLKMLEDEAYEAGLAYSYVLAICSRETDCRNVLGDARGGDQHGVGLMQVDIQHDFAREMRDDGTWLTDPRRLVRFACGLLAADLQQVTHSLPTDDPPAAAKITAAAYNCGFRAAWQGHLQGDCDQYTTGHDYGEDILERAKVFQILLDEQ